MDPLVPLSYVNQLANTTVNYGLIGVIVILVFSGAFFSGVETALTCCNRARMKTKADDGYKSAKLVTRILNKYDQSLITAWGSACFYAPAALRTEYRSLSLWYQGRS